MRQRAFVRQKTDKPGTIQLADPTLKVSKPRATLSYTMIITRNESSCQYELCGVELNISNDPYFYHAAYRGKLCCGVVGNVLGNVYYSISNISA